MEKKEKKIRKMQGMLFYDTQDLEEILGLTNISVRQYLSSGKIKAIKIKKRWLVSEKNLNIFLDTTPVFKLPEKVIIKTIVDEVLKNTNEMIQKAYNKGFEEGWKRQLQKV